MSQPPIKKGGETHFYKNRKDKRKNQLSQSTVFLQSERPSGRKERKTAKRRGGHPAVNNASK